MEDPGEGQQPSEQGGGGTHTAQHGGTAHQYGKGHQHLGRGQLEVVHMGQGPGCGRRDERQRGQEARAPGEQGREQGRHQQEGEVIETNHRMAESGQEPLEQGRGGHPVHRMVGGGGCRGGEQRAAQDRAAEDGRGSGCHGRHASWVRVGLGSGVIGNGFGSEQG